MYYGTYTCISDLILVSHNLYMYFRSYTCLTEHILVLHSIYLSYSCAKVPVGTISRNRSDLCRYISDMGISP